MTRPDASLYPRPITHAIDQSEATSIGAALAGESSAHAGQSGFRFLVTGTESLQYRMALIQAAEKSLDLQYYTIHDDTSANLLLEAMLRAAKRGVRVRFLVDHVSMKEVAKSFSVLNEVENIEIRVFNPPVTRDQGIFSRISGIIEDIGKITKRMHNKALIVDNQMSIIGGRNLGDEYFDAHADANFKDADMLVAGPVTAQISRSFDRYWNCDDAFPIDAVKKPASSPQEIATIKQALNDQWNKELATKDGKTMLQSDLKERLKNADIGLIWAEAELAADDPGKINEKATDAASKPLQRMEALLKHATKEFIVVSPYFVPQDDGVALLTGLTGKGVKVSVLTNSLASTDVVAVHAGYQRYRKTIIENGIELFELKAIDGKKPKQRLFGASSPAQASLHSKLYMIDRKTVVIGSFNFDPRSISLNTELALVIHSPEIAKQVSNMFREATDAKSSYHLSLADGKKLQWMTEEKGHKQVFTRDPEAGFWRPIEKWLIGLLPIENQV